MAGIVIVSLAVLALLTAHILVLMRHAKRKRASINMNAGKAHELSEFYDKLAALEQALQAGYKETAELTYPALAKTLINRGWMNSIADETALQSVTGMMLVDIEKLK
jgi:hypothetical protein